MYTAAGELVPAFIRFVHLHIYNYNARVHFFQLWRISSMRSPLYHIYSYIEEDTFFPSNHAIVSIKDKPSGVSGESCLRVTNCGFEVACPYLLRKACLGLFLYQILLTLEPPILGMPMLYSVESDTKRVQQLEIQQKNEISSFWVMINILKIRRVIKAAYHRTICENLSGR